MMLLWLMLAQPMLPPQPAAVVITPPSMMVTLTWSNSPTAGCSNRLYSWTDSATNVSDVGSTNVVRVTQRADLRTYHAVKAVRDEVESAPSNVIGVPPKPVLDFCFNLDGTETVLLSYTNQPPGRFGQLYTKQREDYSP